MISTVLIQKDVLFLIWDYLDVIKLIRTCACVHPIWRQYLCGDEDAKYENYLHRRKVLSIWDNDQLNMESLAKRMPKLEEVRIEESVLRWIYTGTAAPGQVFRNPIVLNMAWYNLYLCFCSTVLIYEH